MSKPVQWQPSKDWQIQLQKKDKKEYGLEDLMKFGDSFVKNYCDNFQNLEDSFSL
jgi:hypothetical protein